MQLQPHHAAVPPIGPRGSIRITRLASNEFRSVCHAAIACWPGAPEELPCSVRYPTSEQGKQSRPATTWATSRAACSRVLQVTARGPQSAPPPCLHPDWLAQCCCQGYTVRAAGGVQHPQVVSFPGKELKSWTRSVEAQVTYLHTCTSSAGDLLQCRHLNQTRPGKTLGSLCLCQVLANTERSFACQPACVCVCRRLATTSTCRQYFRRPQPRVTVHC